MKMFSGMLCFWAVVCTKEDEMIGQHLKLLLLVKMQNRLTTLLVTVYELKCSKLHPLPIAAYETLHIREIWR